MSSRKYFTRVSGKVRWRVTYVDPITGDYINKAGFLTKTEADRWELEHRAGKHDKPDKKEIPTVGELGEQWIKGKKHLRPSAYKSLRNAWENRVKPKWEDVPVNELTTPEIRDWINGLETLNANNPRPLAATGKRYARQAISNILDDAKSLGFIQQNPCDDIKPPKKSKASKRYLMAEQLEAFADNVEDEDKKILIRVLGYTGLRWGEAIALRGKHVHKTKNRLLIEVSFTEENGVETTPKTGEARSVPVMPTLMKQIRKLAEKRGHDNLLWARKEGKHLLRPRTDRKNWFVQAQEAAGFKEIVSAHELRHTAASLAVSAGAHVKTLQRMLGHNSAAVTLDTYTELFDSDLDQIAESMEKKYIT